MAAKSTGVDASAITTTSDGPAKADGTPTSPAEATSRLACATRALPGPTITSTGADGLGAVGEGADGRGTADPVHLVDPGERGGGQDAGATVPSGCGEVTRTTSGTPATLAGMAVMSTVDTRGASADGT